MRKLGVIIAILSIGVLAAIGWVSAQGSSSSAETLTGQDYGEIMQLYGMYNQGSDFRDPELWASIFTDDGVFRPASGQEVVGRDALLARAQGRVQGQTGPGGARHYTSSWVITPTVDGGAKARAYWFVMNVSGEQPRPVASGYYDDVFVKTPKGWRIKSRALHSDRVAQ